MEDAVRPNEQAFRAMYKRGYCTWFSLYEMTIADTKTQLPSWDCLFQLENAFLNYPSFPENPAVDASFSNTVIATGISTWRTAQGPCDLPSFDQEFFIPVASDRPTILSISGPQQSTFVFPRSFSEDDDHITLLILAWTYILSARWAEIIPGASGPEYSNCEAEWDDKNIPLENAPTDATTAVIDLGDIDDDNARWWSAVLALEGGWNASIPSDKGPILHSPWYTKLVSEKRFILSRGTKSRPLPFQHRAASFATALRYLSSYCEFHKVAEQNHAALAATLLLPVARFDKSRVQLPTPRVRRKVRLNKESICKTPAWSENLNQLDRLLSLSCNAVGTKALLNSVFFEPGVACNICGAWLQGTFAFLDSDIVQDQHILLRVLMKRDPSLGFLWLGAFIIGAQTRSLQEARQAWWKIDLHVAAWTGTLKSFIQEPVSTLPPGTEEISRADECRLMYLSHDQYYTVPPLFPFAPFGSTAITDTNIDVRQHARCETSHGLEYEGLTWRCRGGQSTVTAVPRILLRAKGGQPTDGNISVTYDNLDHEDDDCSEMVTRNIFTWLRDEDGFPVTERAIREHEWIDNLDSDDDCPITGDAQSTVGGNLHGWLLKTMTRRSNSL
ncbi:uncharacterized protein LY89DRAFT_102789 [Mollisia scopiformis]|uniref:Uncharacterized protein n=1 Tax=Mollisia scopiformis TaxID=149040 RepID=A0A194X7D9_MOLSC|nr:uncharacterized protein LY89DRAFT_102789 [Mollisia scopiformis]KUJ16076.1 hypothetical protein LY89DRAFT_102789 [Mollisia scopiformis]